MRIPDCFDNHFVLGYANGHRWLDIHPLVAQVREVQAAIASPPATP